MSEIYQRFIELMSEQHELVAEIRRKIQDADVAYELSHLRVQCAVPTPHSPDTGFPERAFPVQGTVGASAMEEPDFTAARALIVELGRLNNRSTRYLVQWKVYLEMRTDCLNDMRRQIRHDSLNGQGFDDEKARAAREEAEAVAEVESEVGNATRQQEEMDELWEEFVARVEEYCDENNAAVTEDALG